MKATELRIGNYVKFGELMHKTTYHDIRNLYESELINKVPSGSYNPIPLTEQWLKDFNWNKKDEYWYDEDKGHRINKLSINTWMFESHYVNFEKEEELTQEWIFIKIFQNVHKFQNLIFELTEIELIKTSLL